MTKQWQELKETIIEMRDNDGIGTQQQVCKFLVNLMDILEKQMPIEAIITGHNNAINTDIGRCPICNGVKLRACDHNYCPDCGQKLKWSDEE